MIRRGSREWLGLGDASRLLGVAPGTLRRWSDSGDVTTFTTPGGHRRYRRSAIERLIATERGGRPSLVRAGMTQTRLASAYRRQVRAAGHDMPWVLELDTEQREWFRRHGRALAESLLHHLDSSDADSAQTSLAEATAEAAEYGRMASRLGLSLGQGLEGFLEFRRPFLHQLALFARRRGLDAATTTELMESAERAMDRLLLAAVSAQSVERVAAGRRETDSEGLV